MKTGVDELYFTLSEYFILSGVGRTKQISKIRFSEDFVFFWEEVELLELLLVFTEERRRALKLVFKKLCSRSLCTVFGTPTPNTKTRGIGSILLDQAAWIESILLVASRSFRSGAQIDVFTLSIKFK